MKNLDRISGIILFLLGLGIFLKSLTYPIGSFRSPGGGLFPLLASIILMGLSGAMTIQAFWKKNTEESSKASFFSTKDAPKRILFGFMALLGFRYLLPVIGFGPSTFLFILLLAKSLGHYSWKMSIFFSVLAALVAYYLFQVWLKIPMPQGMLRI
ncbi:MAG: tripartite tricarboxylate transporter TctB family protein [Deltaproteobacteria bacterium]|nr:tripartite tricarboxylate transporter TctB family protein [Deltaproteobacteria bacterium]